MSLNDLFSVNTTVHLTADMNSWADQITSALLSKYPSLSKLIGEVVFAKVDSIKGNAVGYITLINKTYRIPFIVDQMELNPLDLYIDNTVYQPLTENTVTTIEQGEWPFRLLSQPERATIIKTASLLEDSGKLKDEFIKKHKEELAKIAESFPETIQDYSTFETPKVEEPKKIAYFFVKKASDSEPLVERTMVSSDKSYKLSEFANKYGKEFAQRLMSEQNIIWSNMPPKVKLQLHESEVDGAYNPDHQSRVGFYKDGANYVAAKIYDHFRLSSLSKSPYTPICVITNKGQYLPGVSCLQKRTTGDTCFAVNLDLPKIGELAGLIIGDNFYGPFVLNSIGRVEGDAIYTVTDNELNKVNLRMTDHIRSIVKVDDSNYLVSKITQLIPIHNSASGESVESILKSAGTKVTVSKQLNNEFVINDGNVTGIPSEKLRNLKKMDATVVLMHCGLSENDSRYALLKAFETGTYTFDAPEDKKEVKEEKDETLVKKAEEINSLCEDSELLKIAVISNDKSNIDIALGLNLINYKNIKRFRLLIPEIKEMLDKLCKLLIIKRMNRSLFNVEESKLTQAIMALDEIRHVLKSL